MSPPSDPAARIRAAARALGFDAAGIARLDPLTPTEEERLRTFLREGRHGTMTWLAREPERRLEPARLLPGARSVVSVGKTYFRFGEEGPGSERIARYARRRDYHKVFDSALKRLEGAVAAALPGVRTRRYVDTGPVLEKLWAERAGLGWRGKHTNLVSREHGSWLLLGEVLLDRELPPDEPAPDRCGTCSRCIAACPTGAITGPYRMDARLCISYLTIEHRGSIPEALRPLMGGRVFGCDDCLDVCPWNRFARESREADFTPRSATLAPLLEDLVALDEAGFLARFAGTPVTRAKRDGLARNACVALGNVGGAEAFAALERAQEDPSPLVREHAAWAIARLEERGVTPPGRGR